MSPPIHPVRPEVYFDKVVFPEFEGRQYEFKLNIPTKRPQIMKIYETVCGFLNSEGGFIIIGIEDNTRNIIGISHSVAHVKNYVALTNDGFSKQIVDQTTKLPLPPGLVHSEAHQTAFGKHLIVIEIKTNGEHRYELLNGQRVVRVNASNHTINHRRTYSVQEYHDALRQEEEKHIQKVKELSRNINTESIKNHENRADKVVFEELLTQKILQEKVPAESRIIANRDSYDGLSIVELVLSGCMGGLLK